MLELWSGLRRDGTWAAFECFLLVQRQQGKGWDLKARELTGLFVWGERNIVYSAHRLKTVSEHFNRVFVLVDGSADLTRRVKKIINNNNEKSITLMSGAKLDFVVRSGGGGGRGLSGEVVILDEALYLAAKDIEALGPTMLAMPNAQVIFASTPPETPEAYLMDLRERAERGETRMAGAAWWNPQNANVNDEAVIAAVNPAYGGRVGQERMQDMRRLLGEAGFARECGGIWPVRITADTSDRIDPVRWKTLLADKDSERVGGVTLAVDIAPLRDWAAIGLYGLRDDGLGHLRLVDYRPGTDWIIERMVELRDVLGADLLGWAMGRGTFASLDADLRAVGITRPEKPEEPRRGDLHVLTATDMGAACAQMIDAAKATTFRQVPSQPLDDAILVGRVQVRGDTIAWVRKGAGGEVAPVVTVTEARWLHESWSGLLSEEDYDLAQSFY